MRATYVMLDLKTKCCPNPRSIIVLLYLHWLRIKYSIQTIHKQTDHDETSLSLDELIWDKLALVWINSYNITTVHVIQVAKQQIDTTWDELVSDKLDS